MPSKFLRLDAPVVETSPKSHCGMASRGVGGSCRGSNPFQTLPSSRLPDV